MFNKFWRAFGMILNRDRIPKLPRGMLATRYENISDDERRVMARMGTRDVNGVRLAMRRHGVSTAKELIELLEHQKPKRNFWHRIHNGIGRAVGGEDHDPHQEEIRQAFRPNKKSQQTAEIMERAKAARRAASETRNPDS